MNLRLLKKESTAVCKFLSAALWDELDDPEGAKMEAEVEADVEDAVEPDEDVNREEGKSEEQDLEQEFEFDEDGCRKHVDM